jgi:hypothetical protein
MGYFSWITQDTDQPIYIDGYQKPGYKQRTYYMWDNNGNFWEERSYQGYGMFGGKDYHVLLAEMNRVYDENVLENQKRVDGINIEFYDNHDEIFFPNLTEISTWTWRNKQPRLHDNQGQYCSEDDWMMNCNHFK